MRGLRLGRRWARLGLAGLVVSTATACGEPFEAAEASCRAQLDAHPEVAGANGAYELNLDAPGAAGTSRVWCDMTTDGGGWLLVARTADSGTYDPWGWNHATGSVDDLSRPYSLGAGALGVSFTEMLIADQNPTTGTIDSHAYVLDAPAGFFTEYAHRGYDFQSLRTVVGGCVPSLEHSGLAVMFRWTGYSAEENVYFFRDLDDLEHFGLTPDGWNLTDGECGRNGEIHWRPGLIMVR